MSTTIRIQEAYARASRRTLYLRDDYRYRIVRRLASTTNTKVYLAKEGEQGIPVVIKRLAKAGNDRAAFLQERKIMGILNQEYPNLAITRLRDWFDSDRAWYFILDFVEGQNLDVLLRRRGRPFPVQDVIEIGLTLCDILAVCHEHSTPIIHCDLKPANILRRPNGQIILGDFGAACFAGCSKSLRGTYGYAAPEQRGRPPSPVTDIYGLGITLGELLTAQKPCGGLALPTSIPGALSHVLRRMVYVSPALRYPSIHHVAQALLEMR